MTTRLSTAAIIEPLGAHAGMHVHDFALVESLRLNNVPADLYTCSETAIPSALSGRVHRTFHGIYGRSPRFVRGLRYAVGVRRSLSLARAAGSPLVHLHFFLFSYRELMTLRYVKRLGFRTTVTVHDNRSFGRSSSRYVTAAVLDEADSLITHNRASYHELISFKPGLHDKLRIAHLAQHEAWTPPAVERETARSRLGLAPDADVVLFFGLIKSAKGLDLLIRALASAVGVNPRLHLVVAGRPWRQSVVEYEALISELGLTAHVTVHARHIDDCDLPLYFCGCDLVVLPYYRIYNSAVLMTAYRYKTPVLASDLPAFREVVSPGVDGFLFTVADEKALTDQLIAVFERRDILSASGDAGYRLLQSYYDPKRSGAATADAYKLALAGAPARSRVEPLA